MVREPGSHKGTGETSLVGPQKILSEYERNVILLAAQGKNREATGNARFVSVSAVKTHRLHAFDKLGVRTIEGAIIAALRRREILPEEVLPETYDRTRARVDTLTPGEQRVLDAVTEEGRTITSHGRIAADLSLAETTVKTHMGRIVSKLGASNKEQTIAIAVSVQLIEEQRCLTSLASAVYQEDLTEIMERRFSRESLARLRKRFGTIGIFETVFAGIRNQVLDREQLTEGFDENRLSELHAEDIALLKRFIKDDGKLSTYTTIAKEAAVTTDEIARRFARIRSQLEIDIHPGILYYALQHKPVVRTK